MSCVALPLRIVRGGLVRASVGLEWIVGLQGVGGIRTNRERVASLSVCPIQAFLLLAFTLSAPLLSHLARKAIGRLFATLSGTKWAELPVDCCYLSSDKET